MDAFEAVVASILQRRGYWTQTSVKVELTKDDKLAIGRPSSPRWELDVVGYSGRQNRLMVVECKSYLDSPGVRCSAFDGSGPEKAKAYKLFFEPKLRRVVLGRLVKQLHRAGFCAGRPRVQFGLAAGKIRGDESWLASHFESKGWVLWGPELIRDELKALRDVGYENSVAAIVAKLLLRGQSGDPDAWDDLR